ncbi:hypothetical protein L228DRAFT_269459 [Xylona heveae TC161]|uniref:WW domain-containing protein n=1 Tax=Xylona heveae (strain CBS 132557 / TC161) TaxID=1328760 RepID=A0A165FJQ5_XYLHT|nr:hypothetical protein L228DRAFT_269459 [Xylona heveae TC161]KZF21057.1 hypothetical protein L228DRAFT_269459 [Xylona heveae TC161]
MLKSTHRPQNVGQSPPPLPPGWTEHKAPTGHSYYYNAELKKSTYTRPTVQTESTPAEPAFGSPWQSYPPGIPVQAGSPFGPFQQQYGDGFHRAEPAIGFQSGFTRPRDGRGHHDRARHQPQDRPKSKHAIPDCSPWLLVRTKLKRRFVYNSETNESYWRIPEDVMKGVVEFDRIEREKKEARERGEDVSETLKDTKQTEVARTEEQDGSEAAEDVESDEYEEVEVTDEEDDLNENPTKRQKTEEEQVDQPVDFNEDDIAYQLAAMGQEYGLDPGEYGDGEGQEWEEGAEGLPLTEEDSAALFKDLLSDHNLNPFSTWDKIIDEGRIIDDDRYTVLPNMKARRAVWDEWAQDKIRDIRAKKEKEVKKDPRIPYFTLLEKYATPKLYWQEFKRKYKKESEMRDLKLSDKDREKWYREYISRLKLSSSTLKSDLSVLLKSLPLSELNRSSQLENLPSALLSDLRFVSVSPSVRDELISAYISTLPAAPEPTDLSEEDQTVKSKEAEERKRREKALQARAKKVEEDKRRQQKELDYGKDRLREEEEQIQQAMKFGKQGLLSHLETAPEHGTEIANGNTQA